MWPLALGFAFFPGIPLILTPYWQLQSKLGIGNIRAKIGVLYVIGVLIAVLLLMWMKLSWEKTPGCILIVVRAKLSAWTR